MKVGREAHVQGLEFWHWLGIAAAVGILEMLTVSGLFLWLAAAALAMASLLYLMPTVGWQMQLLLFAGVSGTLLLATRLCFRSQAGASLLVNRRAERYIGQTVTLDGPMINGRGRVVVGGSLWQVEGMLDMPAGSVVKVVKVDGIVLRVEPVREEAAPVDSSRHSARAGAAIRLDKDKR